MSFAGWRNDNTRPYKKKKTVRTLKLNVGTQLLRTYVGITFGKARTRIMGQSAGYARPNLTNILILLVIVEVINISSRSRLLQPVSCVNWKESSWRIIREIFVEISTDGDLKITNEEGGSTKLHYSLDLHARTNSYLTKWRLEGEK